MFGQGGDSCDLKKSPLFTSFEQANTVPADSVFRLALKRNLPDNFEQKIKQYPHLQELHLNNMRLKQVPEVIWSLSKLTILDLSNNKIDSLSYRIGHLNQLKQLILNRNYLIALPLEITLLPQLYYLDLWSNLIIEFPSQIEALKNSLKIVDMRVINIDDQHRELMQLLLPQTKFLFSKSCNCKN
jgi:Leucine-rich repeat (LRR) protein